VQLRSHRMKLKLPLNLLLLLKVLLHVL
jgi:hypothetical protein